MYLPQFFFTKVLHTSASSQNIPQIVYPLQSISNDGVSQSVSQSVSWQFQFHSSNFLLQR
jgi:hypothetical protein